MVEISDEAYDIRKTPAVTGELKIHLTAAKNYMKTIVKQHEMCKAEFIDSTYVAIPKKLKQLKHKILEAFSALEKGVLTELAKERLLCTTTHDSEIAEWTKRIKKVEEAVQLLSSVQQSGSTIHMYIVVNNLHKILNGVDAAISGQGNTLASETASLDVSFGLQKVMSSPPCALVQLNVLKTSVSLPEYPQTQTVVMNKQSSNYYDTGYMSALSQRFQRCLTISNSCPYCHTSWQTTPGVKHRTCPSCGYQFTVQ